MRKSGTEPETSDASQLRNGLSARSALPPLVTACCLLACLGCGTMKAQQATEQLLLSRAVDESIARLDFRDLSGKKVYLDTTYLQPIKGAGFVNSDYIISSLRQQLFAAHCLVQEKKEDADYVVEPRVGALGADGHEVVYGVPASSQISSAATLLPNTPVIPPIPEIALAKRSDNLAAAKVAVFAYHRESRLPVWQSGMTVSRSQAKDVWVFGAGPFQSGSIYDKARFAGDELALPSLTAEKSQDDATGEQSEDDATGQERPKRELVDYFTPRRFDKSLAGRPQDPNVRPAGFEEDSQGKPAKISVSDQAETAGTPAAEAGEDARQAAKN